MKLSVVVPVYNSEASLPELIARLKPVLEKIATDYELIIVNDGSRDNSWEAVKKAAESNDWIHGINLMRNYGQHNALLCGIREAHGDVIVTMDDDLQNPPEEIPKLLEELDSGFDVVYGTPRHERHGLWRDLASRMTKLALQSSMDIETARNVSPFRAFRTKIRDAFSAYKCPFISIDVLLTWGASRFGAVKVKHEPRKHGVSNYSFYKLVTHALNMMTSFSMLPLQLASLMGILFAFFGLAMLIFVLVRYVISGAVVPGFAFLASAIAIFSGVQLFALGIIGEYIARVHFRTMDRPPYVIRSELGKGENNDL